MEKLLNFGKNQLIKFKNDELNFYNKENITGIEGHLKDEFLDDMIKINNIIYTTASTNEPEDSKF